MKEQLRSFSTRFAEKSQNLGREAVRVITHPGIGARVLLATLVGSGAGLEMSNISLGQNQDRGKTGTEQFMSSGMPSFNTGIVRAQEVPTPSEDPYFPEDRPGNPYFTIAQEGQAPWDEMTFQIQTGLIQTGDCVKVTEMQSSEAHEKALRDKNPNEEVFRHLFEKVDMSNCVGAPVTATPTALPVCRDYEFLTGPWRKDNLTDSFVGHGDFFVETSQGVVRTFDIGDGSAQTGSITMILPNGQSFSVYGDYGTDLYCNPDELIRRLNIKQGIANLQSQGKTALVNVLEYDTSTGKWTFHPLS